MKAIITLLLVFLGLSACQPAVEHSASAVHSSTPTDTTPAAPAFHSETLTLVQDYGVYHPDQPQDGRRYDIKIEYQQTSEAKLNTLLQQSLLEILSNSSFDIKARDLLESTASIKTAIHTVLAQLDPELAHDPVTLHAEQHFIGRHGRLVLFKTNVYTYLGDNHGSDVHYYFNYDLHTAEMVRYRDLVIPGQETQLAQVLYEHYQNHALLQEFGPQERQDFWAAWQDTIRTHLAAPEQFTFTDEGVVFSFAPEQLGPAVMGSVELLLPYAEADGLIAASYVQP